MSAAERLARLIEIGHENKRRATLKRELSRLERKLAFLVAKRRLASGRRATLARRNHEMDLKIILLGQTRDRLVAELAEQEERE